VDERPSLHPFSGKRMGNNHAVIGIDPGTTGAAALLVGGQYEAVLDWRGNAETARTFALWVDVYQPLMVAIEKVHAFPNQGVVSVATFARSAGWWDGLLSFLDPPRREVLPKEWQRVIHEADPDREMERSKHASLELARSLYPDAPLKLVKHHNRAEALLIARWVWDHAVAGGKLHDEQQEFISAYRAKWESRYRKKHNRRQARSPIQDPGAQLDSLVVRRSAKTRGRKKV
jgi:crossover junction endodeoxyribonuclease RuvC